MLRQALVAVVLSGCGLTALTGWAAHPKKKFGKVDPSSSAVEKILRAEVAGEVDRRTELADLLNSRSGSLLAHWQAGFVREGDAWRSFDAPRSSRVDSDAWREYVSRRERAGSTRADQVDLADWCRRAGLVDQEQAHLTAALALASPREQLPLLERLGWQQVGTHWLSPEQLSEWQRGNRAAEDSLKKYSSKLEHIAQRLEAGKRPRESAMAELHALTERSAIPAIELILAGRDELCAEAAVEALRRIEGPESSLALAKQAVFSEWPDVRESASVALKSRNFDEFVPGLISLLAVPAQREQRFIYDASGVPLLQSYILAVETEDQFCVEVFNVASQYIDRVVGIHSRATRDGPIVQFVLGPPQANPDKVRMLADRLHARELEQDAIDERVLALDNRVGQTLATVSGTASSTDPHHWWQWWSDKADTQMPDKKAVIVSEQDAAVQYYIPTLLSLPKMSCFAAGTPVWTETGLAPIEKIRIGDKVLAKDVETGELTYKVVLKTTVRPPKELTTLRFGDETIICTGGHRFWSSGTGWIKARDLTPQTLLHTATGNTPVWSAKKGETAETYNLIVADFHTYFVGKTGVLCQDLLIPKGTNSLVPGLARK